MIDPAVLELIVIAPGTLVGGLLVRYAVRHRRREDPGTYEISFGEAKTNEIPRRHRAIGRAPATEPVTVGLRQPWPLPLPANPAPAPRSPWMFQPAPARKMCDHCRAGRHLHLEEGGECFDLLCSCPYRPAQKVKR